MTDSSAYLPIQDYAIIGDCGSAALVSRYGSIDWLCWPRFDSPSLFGALLDARRGGRFSIRPAGPCQTERRYLEATNVLETTFTTETGVLCLTDLMPVTDEAAYESTFRPDHELLRRISCEAGEVEVEVHFDPRPDYGRARPRIQDRGRLGFFFNDRKQGIVLRSDLPLRPAEAGLSGRVRLRQGERRYLALCSDLQEPAILPLLGTHAEQRIDDTCDYWRTWSARCNYDGPYRDAVLRSALTLKLMTYSQSGAIVAAPTTSLPEQIGGERNWDYRFCWLRDAALTLRALFELGYAREGDAFFAWLLHAIGGTQPRLNVLYDVYGGSHVHERHLDHLEGYKASRPVRIGNGAYDQLQLDIYGEVVSAAFEYVKRGGELTGSQARLMQKLGQTVCERWHEPDEGVWEVRSGRKHHTYSKVMCWVALDRLLQLHAQGHLQVPAEHFAQVRDEIREAVETRGFNREMNSYTATFDGDTLDASLLLLSVYGYIDPADPRMRSTAQCIQERLARGTLLYRYNPNRDDGLPGGEGAFGICSFWDEILLAQTGRVDDACTHLDQTLAYANDVGLFSEEIDVATGAALGNFPQAFTHVGLINAVLSIAEARGRRRASGLDEHLHREDATRGHPDRRPSSY